MLKYFRQLHSDLQLNGLELPAWGALVALLLRIASPDN